MNTPITSFDGEFRFLSNFWPATVTLDGVLYPSVEHAYQAAKTLDSTERNLVRAERTASGAKRLGRRVTMRPDWMTVRLAVMADLLRQKFSHPALAEQLRATGDRPLIEGNYWNDTFWGVCRGTGQNHLGHLLMQIRKELR